MQAKELAAKPFDWLASGYDALVAWYESRSPEFHWAAFLGIVGLGLFELCAIYVEPPWLVDRFTYDAVLEDYRVYTPVYWLFGLLSCLIAVLIMRYSKVLFVKKYLDPREWRAAQLARPWQLAIVLVTGAALVVEVYGIATGRFTISAATRDFANAWHPAYWLGGVVTGVLAGLLVDLKSLPELIKLCTVTWVAVLSHIFWWITPN